MIAFHLLRMVLHLFVGLFKCGVIFPLTDAAGRQRRIRQWSIELLAICGMRVNLRNPGGAPAAARALIVSNHISWLDIFVINSLQPCRFVAKSDIRDWPLMGWLCEKSGTIFIARGKQRDVRRIYEGMVNSLHDGERVAFFPEGTTAAQGTLLSFHANLFEAAIDAEVPIQPYALRYVDSAGRFHPELDFVGDMTFVESMIAILRVRKFTAEIIQLPPLASIGAHRRELASAARASIGSALGYPIEPITPAAGTAGSRPETPHDLPAARQ
ncbi:MAG: lysophospholipid acyltransferase family protein [Pseudomonadota bacterium]